MRVTLKLATSLDGRIATASGESRWITGPEARQWVHRMRMMHAAVVVGVETAIADDPELTVRLGAVERVALQPARVVLDSRLRLPVRSRLVQTARDIPTYVMTVADPGSNARLTDAGARVIQVAEDGLGRPDLRAALAALEAIGMTAVMVEGGGQVAAGFLSAGLVDAIEWFRAPMVLGDEGRPSVGAFVLKDLAAAPRFRRTTVREVGNDLWERYERI
jgi:diaminohydroxyphosphoribosylaminopyrimidine deaminase/5-amino-6-(5-phosphoribosylamino)uracil reductase